MNTISSPCPRPSTRRPNLKTSPSQVLVVFKTHLDVGFTDSAAAVRNGYLRHFIPAVLRLARETRQSKERYVWTTGSWLVYRFLEEATPRLRREMEEAVEEGDFHWHALPFTTHSELMPPDLFRAGLFFSQRLDQRFGRRTIAAKMTGVPGHTRGIVPILADAGVQMLHIGVNPASTVPEVPPCFRWQCAGREIVVIYEKEYGADTLLPDGMVLSVNLTNDNLGPHRLSEMQQVYAQLKQKFPRASIFPGSLDQAAAWIGARRQKLPVITKEIGDTWIHGIGSDPVKVNAFREMTRLRRQWIRIGRWNEADDSDLAFVEPLLLVAEHTWGMDIKTHLNEWSLYTAEQLRHGLTLPAFRKVAASWREQRRYLKEALRVLPDELQSEARSALHALCPRKLKSLPGAHPVATGQRFDFGIWQLAVNENGAITSLRRSGTRRDVANDQYQLAALSYQIFSAADYERFYRQYNTNDVDWARKDFKKIGLVADIHSATFTPYLRALNATDDQFRAELAFAEDVVLQGAPDGISLEAKACPDGFDLVVQWLRKIPTRWPEAIWLRFNPIIATGAWRFEKMGVDLDPRDVVNRGNRALHGVSGAVRNGILSVESSDAILVSPGEPRLLDFNNRLPDLHSGITYNLFNNIWGTNFSMWNGDGSAFRFRFRWNF